MAATLQSKCSGGIYFVIITKIITKIIVPGNFFVIIFGQDGIPFDVVEHSQRLLAFCRGSLVLSCPMICPLEHLLSLNLRQVCNNVPPLRVMYGTKYLQFCATLACNLQQLCALRSTLFGFGKRGLLEKGSFQKSPFSRDSREFRDSRDFREPPDCGNQRKIRPFF